MLLLRYEGNTKSACDNHILPATACRACGELDHWGNECPSRIRVKPKAAAAPAAAKPEPPWRQNKKMKIEEVQEEDRQHCCEAQVQEGGDWTPMPYRFKADESNSKLLAASAKYQARKRPRPEREQTAFEASASPGSGIALSDSSSGISTAHSTKRMNCQDGQKFETSNRTVR